MSRTAINSTSTVYKSTSWTRRGGDDVFEISTIRCLEKGGWRADVQNNGPSNIWYSECTQKQVSENHVHSSGRGGGKYTCSFSFQWRTHFQKKKNLNWSPVWLQLKHRRLPHICLLLHGIMSHELLSQPSERGAFRSIIILFTIMLDYLD